MLIIVITLAAAIYFSDEATPDFPPLTDRDSSTIHSINIHRNNATTTLIRVTPTQWQLTQPINIAANTFRLNSLLDLLHAPVNKRYSADAVDLKSLGLLDSQTNVQFDDLTIVFGATNPATNLRFVQIANSVYTVEDVYFPFFNSHFSTLVSLNLLPASSTISKLVLLNQTISKDDAGLWHSNRAISADNINAVVDDWKNLQAFGVHEYIKRDALGEIFIFTTQNTEPISYVITDTDPWLIIARPELGLEYHLDIAAYDKLIAPK